MSEGPPRRLCPICGSWSHLIWSHERFPLYQLPSESYADKNYLLDIGLYFCSACLHGHIDPTPDDSTMERFYREEYGSYTSVLKSGGLTAGLTAEAFDYITEQIEGRWDRPIAIADVGGGDGYVLERLKPYCSERLLIEPAHPVAEIAREWNIPVREAFLDRALASALEGCFDLVISRHVVEHVRHPEEFVANLLRMATTDGLVIVETPDFVEVLKKGLVRVVQLQHFHYISLESLAYMAGRYASVESHGTIAGAFLIAALNKRLPPAQNRRRAPLLDQRAACAAAADFATKVDRHGSHIRSIVKRWRAENRNIWIWGAGSAAGELFSLYGQDIDDFVGVIDSDERKTRMRLPRAPELPIVTPTEAEKLGIDAILIASFSVKEILNSIRERGWRIEVADIYSANVCCA